MTLETSRGAGRPRDASMDARATAAALEFLAAEGFEGTTVQAVAARSGVHASALYRRWPSRIELIEDAIFPGLSVTAVEPSGDLHKDLRRFIRSYVAVLGTPAARAAIPGLLTHYQSSGRSRRPEEWLPLSARPQFRDILRAAPDGAIDPDVDVDDVFDFMLSAIIGRMLVPTISSRNRPMERIVEMVLRLLQPLPESVGALSTP
jgi:AcrR family transcriptional regulator